MYSTVKRLRRGGARLADRDIQADPGTVGHLTMVGVAGTRELKLHGAGDDSKQGPLIPVLFDAEMISMHGARMLFKGFERQGNQADRNGYTVMQEWSIEVMTAQPSELARMSHRSPD